MNKKYFIFIGIVFIVLGVFMLRPRSKGPQKFGDGFVCIADARQCPDGSYVTRSGPKCEFNTCPNIVQKSNDTTSDWKTYKDSITGVSFKYPEKLPTTYIHAYVWPPKVTVENKSFSCTETAQNQTGPINYVHLNTINSREYCITTKVEGAAGSTYINFIYKTLVNNKLVGLNFTLQEVQCMNYEQPKQNECLQERGTFHIDQIIDSIIHTTTLSK